MYGHSDASFWRWLLAVVLGHPLTTNGPSCTTLHRAILHNSHLRINSVRKGSTSSGNASSEIRRSGLQLRNCSNTNGSLQSNHKFQLIQELQAIVAHQATRTQEAASDKAVCAIQWGFFVLFISGLLTVGKSTVNGFGARWLPSFSSMLCSIRSAFGIRKHQR